MLTVWPAVEQWWSQGLPVLDLAHASPMVWMLMGVVVVLLGVLLALLWRFWRVLRRLREENKEGEKLSVVARGELPLYCFRRDGRPGDPLNLRIIASPAQLGSAFAEAGWYRADEITVVTSLRITVDSVLARGYSTAPVSNLFLYGRRQDFAFERPGRSVRQRDHVRFWDSGLRASDGRPLWVGAATRDISLRLAPRTRLPTHRISPDVDAERETLVKDIVGTGWVIQQEVVPGFGMPTESDNGFGDRYFTDGQVAVLVLANVPVLLPFAATNVRGSAAAVAHALNRVLRWRLPRVGRERAKRQEQQQEREEESARRAEEASERATAPVAPNPRDEG
jgi:hypothetical protein